MEMLKSKKLIISVLTAIGVAVNDYFGKPVSDDSIMQIVGIVAAYVVGQGVADFGKEKAKMENKTKEEKPSQINEG